VGGCVIKEPPPPPEHVYTQGNVTLKLKKGVTTQEQVTEAFGAPNIVTQDSKGDQVWIYQKDNMTVQSSENNSYLTILLIGGQKGNSSYQQSSQTMTLTIHFYKNGVVKSFKSMSTSF